MKTPPPFTIFFLVFESRSLNVVKHLLSHIQHWEQVNDEPPVSSFLKTFCIKSNSNSYQQAKTTNKQTNKQNKPNKRSVLHLLLLLLIERVFSLVLLVSYRHSFQIEVVVFVATTIWRDSSNGRAEV